MNDLDLFEEPSYGGHLGGQELGRRAQRKNRKRQRKRKVTGRAAVLFSLAFLVAVVGGGGLAGVVALNKWLETPDYKGQGTGRVTVQIKEGDFGETIGQRLKAADVVKSVKAYVQAAVKEPKAQHIQPGFYQMRKQMSASAALALLLDPKARAGNQVTVPEGRRVSQVIDQLAEKSGIPLKDFQAVVKDPGGLGLPSSAKGKVEGYLWPGQYNLDPDGTAEATLKLMVDRYKQETQALDLAARAKEAGLKPHEVVTMASLIQAESGRSSDMPKISRVIYNRLERKPPLFLKFDSTTLYGLDKYGIVASNEDIRSDSPYNTYNHPGLPPGPIGNPGAKAIEAVFKPADGAWLFFVTTDPKRKITEFADNEADFQRLRDKLNKYLRENGD